MCFAAPAMKPIISWLSRLTSRIAALEVKYPATANTTTTRDITAAEAYRGITVSNLGDADGVIFNLPAALPGMRVTAVVRETAALVLNPVDTSGKIYSTGATLGAGGKNISADAKGETITLVCIEADHWTPVAFTGTWTVES